MPKPPLPTELPRERAFLVGVKLRRNHSLLNVEDSLAELALLADTAGMTVVGSMVQRLERPNPATFIGSGKVEELQDFVEETVADTVVFDEELTPRHQRELEKVLGEHIKVLDRTALILDIFAQHAHTRDGSLQVELAQYEYRLPRLTRQWTHLARQTGGGGGRAGAVGGVGLRGPGETQLEVDRREIGRRIAYLRAELEKVRAHRSRHRARRRRANIPVVALVGYTNAGKSTLLNALSDADVYIADQLFATLDPTTRRVQLPEGRAVLLTDTVGFIQKLPTTLIAAFRATLEEIAEANLLLHVVDVTHPNAFEQAEAVQQTLDELEMHSIPTLTVLNKIDQLADNRMIADFKSEYPGVAAISALRKQGLAMLLQHIEEALESSLHKVAVDVPYTEGQLIALFHEQGQIEQVEHGETGVTLTGRLPRRLLSKFEPYRSTS